MSNNYYCLIAGIPEFTFDQKKLIFKPAELKEYLKDTLQSSDYKVLCNLFYEFDNSNILHLISQGHEANNEDYKTWFNTLSNHTYDELVMATREADEISTPYIRNFFEEYNNSEKKTDILHWEKHLTQLYYDHIQKCNNKLLKDWFAFDFTLKNVITAIISRAHSLSSEEQMIINSEMLQNIAKSNAKDFGIAVDWPMVSKVVNIFEETNLLKREEAIDMLKWNWLDEATTFEYFSFEVVITIVLKLRIIERWSNADPEKGKALFVNLLEQIKESGKIK